MKKGRTNRKTIKSMSSPLVLEHAIGMNIASNQAMCFHPTEDGHSVLCHSSGKLVVLVDVADPHAQVMLQGHDTAVTCVDISSDGTMLLSGQQSNPMAPSSVILWDYQSRLARYKVPSHNGGVSECKFSPDGKFIATLGRTDGSLYIMDTESMKLLGQFQDLMCGESGREVHGVVWSSCPPAGTYNARNSVYTLCVAFNTGVRIVTWAFDVKKMMYVLSTDLCHVPGSGGRMGGFQRTYLCSCVSLDGAYLLCGTTTGDLVVYSIATKTYRTCISVANNGVLTLHALGDDTYLLGGGDGRVCKIKGRDQDWRLVAEVALGVSVAATALSSDRLECAVMTAPGQLYRVLTADLSHTIVAEFHSSCIHDIAPCSGATHYIATTSADGFARVWDLNTYGVVAKSPLIAATVAPTCLAYTLDSGEIFVGYSDGRVCGYPPNLSKANWTMPQVHKEAVLQIAPSMTYFATIGKNDSMVRIWTMRTRELVSQIQDSNSALCRILIDNTTPHIIHTLGLDGTLFSFDFTQLERRADANMTKPRKIASHTMKATQATCMVQRLDHEHEIVVGTSDGRILFFDIDYVEPVFTIIDRAKVPVLCLSICPGSSSRHFVVGAKDGTLTLYTFDESGGSGAVASAQIVAHSEPVSRVSWSTDGKQVFSVDNAGQLNVSNFFL